MASPLTDDQLSQLRQDIYDHLDSPSGIQDVEDGVKKLVASARSIDEAFQRGTQGFTEALRAFNTLNVTLQKITHSFTQAFKLRASNLSLRTPNVTLQKIIALRKDWKGYHKVRLPQQFIFILGIQEVFRDTRLSFRIQGACLKILAELSMVEIYFPFSKSEDNLSL